MRRTTLLTSIAVLLVAGLLLGAGLQFSGGRPVAAQELTPTNTPTIAPTPTIAAYQVVFERQRGPDIPTLQEMAGDATDDATALARIAAYYEANRDRLALAWAEDNPDRLAALFTMIATHISHVYGETPFPTGVLDFLGQARAHCGTYTWMQAAIARELGLTFRVIEFAGEHAWMEAWIDGHWEIFDATTDTWLNGGVEDMLAGAPRQYAYYYTPLLDITRPDARLHFAEGYNMQRLRQRMPLLGVSYFPPGEQIFGSAVTPEG